MDLQYSYFAIEKSNEITNDDLVNLREFYGPFLGSNPIFLYHYFLDYVKDSNFKRFNYDFAALTTFLNSDLDSLLKARRQLEACGLINSYADHERKIMIFSLQKPLNAFGFKQNQLLSDLLRNHIGEENYKHMIISKTRPSTYKETYNVEDVSTDFFSEFNHTISAQVNNTFVEDVIRIGKSRKSSIQNQRFDFATATKLEIGKIKYPNEYEAILKLTSIQFAEQLINSELDQNTYATISQWQGKLKDDKVLNLILFLSFYHSKRNDGRPIKEWLKHSGSMINEVIQMNLTDFEMVENYFDGKLKNTYDLKVFQKKEILKAALK
ncbi:hypothetical protein [Mycoplasma seminis]|uniref:Replicative helicase loading/DNA remodeling protein DnaB N-terminal winged helix domain-containing protein n=1 Tax=Mycoplasma seminis TaxID=512749 RepID=A0ABY9HBX9_9MOLU|nr:hypothetical protein [Mycoplasma seminis]WLP85956.1 hypothetical protein Q8852_02315 [Mycoplasma seminis]